MSSCVQDQNIFILCYVLHFAQVIFGFQDVEDMDVDDDDDVETEASKNEDKFIGRLLKDVATLTGKADFSTSRNLTSKVREKVTQFLRSSALFFHYYRDVPAPQKSGFSDLCRYLGVPQTFGELVDLPGVREIFDG